MNSHGHSSFWGSTIIPWLQANNWDISIFKPVPDLTLESPLSMHVKWAFKHVYNKRYRNHEIQLIIENEGIERYIHGISHTTWTAILVPVWINLYRKHGHEPAMQLSAEDCKLLQIGALLHDAANQDENGGPSYDVGSGLFVYCYLTRVLSVPVNKAKMIAEAVANKEPDNESVFIIEENADSGITWQWIKKSLPNAWLPTIHAKIIHDADCLHIIRARPHFIAEYLHFYEDLIHETDNHLGLNELAHLICEMTSLIEIQGDTYWQKTAVIKKRYENEFAHERIIADIDPVRHRLIHSLFQHLYSVEALAALELIDSTPYDPALGMTESNMMAARREGRLFARAIPQPANFRKRSDGTVRAETDGEHEMRKLMRERGIPTLSQKNNRFFKFGFERRSGSIASFASGLFYGVGYYVLDPAHADIFSVHSRDNDTGYGKKPKVANPSTDEITGKILKLFRRIKLGGDSIRNAQLSYAANFNEVEMLVSKLDAFFYSNDRTIYNLYKGLLTPLPKHPLANLLQAIYLRKVYEKAYHRTRANYMEHFGDVDGTKKFEKRFGKHACLPIFEHSTTHHYLKQVPETELTEEAIIEMWLKMCSDFMEDLLYKPTKPITNQKYLNDCLRVNILNAYKTVDDLQQATIKGIKYRSMHGNVVLRTLEMNTADSCFSDEFVQRLDAAIDKRRNEIVAEYRQLEAPYSFPLRHIVDFGVNIREAHKMNTLPLLMSFLKQNYRPLKDYLKLHGELDKSIMGTALLCAISQKKVTDVVYLLEHGAPINYRDNQGLTPLIYAISNDSKDNLIMVQTLIMYGAEPNMVPHHGKTALYLAAWSGFTDIVRYLLSVGAKGNVRGATSRSLSPMYAAVNQNHIDIVKLLIENGEDVNFCNDGDSPLDFAASRGNLRLVMLLVKAGATITNPHDAYPAYIFAMRNNHAEVAIYLINQASEAELTLEYENVSNALTAAIAMNDGKEVIKLLLTKGLKINEDAAALKRLAQENYRNLFLAIKELDYFAVPLTISGQTFAEFAEKFGLPEFDLKKCKPN